MRDAEVMCNRAPEAENFLVRSKYCIFVDDELSISSHTPSCTTPALCILQTGLRAKWRPECPTAFSRMQRTSRLLFSATAGTKRTVSTRLRRSLDPALSHTYRSLFSTHVALRQETHAGKAEALKGTTGDAGSNGNGNGQSSADPSTKRKQLPARFRSLRSVAVKAQQPREESDRRPVASDNGQGSNRVTAISVADQYDMDVVIGILRSHGFSIDPDGTGFDSDQVIHTRGSNIGDIFVFPSGTVVAWSLPTDVVSHLATKTLLPAAINAHTQDQTESEHLEFIEDRKRDNSVIKGDVISLGARQLETEDESR